MSLQTNDTEHVVRRALEAWRESALMNMNVVPEQIDYCARHSRVMHDVFLDKIARNAAWIQTPDDLKRVAYYWSHVDVFGTEIYALLRRTLSGAEIKRCRDECIEPASKRAYIA